MSETIYIHYTDKTLDPIVLQKRQIDRTTPFTFTGLGSVNYAQPINQNILYLLENFANNVAPNNPTKGLFWYNIELESIMQYNGTTWTTVGGVISSNTPPTNTDKIWFDTTTQDLKIYNGSSYESVVSQYVFRSGDTVGPTSVSDIVTNTNFEINSPLIIDTVNLLSNSTIQFNTNNGIVSNTNHLRFAANDIIFESERDIIINAQNSISIEHNTTSVLNITSNLIVMSQLNLNSNNIQNVKDPVDSDELVPLYFLTNDYPTLANTFVQDVGDSMTGSLTSSYALQDDGVNIKPQMVINDGIQLLNGNQSSIHITKNSEVLTISHEDIFASNTTDVFSVDLVTGDVDVYNKQVRNVSNASASNQGVPLQQLNTIYNTNLNNVQSSIGKQQIRGRAHCYRTTGNNWVTQVYGCVASATVTDTSTTKQIVITNQNNTTSYFVAIATCGTKTYTPSEVLYIGSVGFTFAYNGTLKMHMVPTYSAKSVKYQPYALTYDKSTSFPYNKYFYEAKRLPDVFDVVIYY